MNRNDGSLDGSLADAHLGPTSHLEKGFDSRSATAPERAELGEAPA